MRLFPALWHEAFTSRDHAAAPRLQRTAKLAAHRPKGTGAHTDELIAVLTDAFVELQARKRGAG